ncbi:MAG: tetratricopeptide repeat protein [Bryobacteraceae bacterium]
MGQPYLTLIPAARRFRQATIKQPLDLLKADRRTVALVGREAELTQLHQWLSGPKPISARTLTGKGGAGKTRLALELLSELEAKPDREPNALHWLGGFLREDEIARFFAQPLFRQWRWRQPALVVIDNAAAVSQILGAWLKALSESETEDAPSLRFLLLERDASLQTGWYQSLVDIGDRFAYERVHDFFDPKEPQELRPLTDAEFRRRVFNDTLDAAHEKLALRHASLPAARKAVEAELEKTITHIKWNEPLVLIMAALDASETGSAAGLQLDRASLALGLARRERQRIKGFAPAEPAGAGDLLVHLAICATLCGGLTRSEAVLVAGRECQELGLQYPGGHGQLARRLADAMPAPSGGLAPILPDLIGEAMLTLHLAGHGQGPFFRCLERKPPAVLDALVRMAQDFHSERSTLGCLTEVLELAKRQSQTGQSDLLMALWRRLPEPEGTYSLRGVVLATEFAVDGVLLAEDSATEVRAQRLARKSIALSAAGRREEALEVAREAVELYRQLDKANTEVFRPALAGSRNNLAVRLSDVGRREEALEAAREAVELYRQLGKSNAEAFRPNLATSLNNLANMLSNVGRREEALEVAREAVELYRQLDKANAEAFRPALATSLNNLANMLSDVGRREEALEVVREAVELYRQLDKANAEAFRPALARSLGTFASISEHAGDPGQALDSSREALVLLAEPFAAWPAVFLALARACLGVHLRGLRALGREPDADALASIAPILATLAAVESSKEQSP